MQRRGRGWVGGPSISLAARPSTRGPPPLLTGATAQGVCLGCATSTRSGERERLSLRLGEREPGRKSLKNRRAKRRAPANKAIGAFPDPSARQRALPTRVCAHVCAVHNGVGPRRHRLPTGRRLYGASLAFNARAPPPVRSVAVAVGVPRLRVPGTRGANTPHRTGSDRSVDDPLPIMTDVSTTVGYVGSRDDDTWT